MGFKTDLAAEKASARVRLEQFKRKVDVIFDTEALIEKISGRLVDGGDERVTVSLEISFHPTHTVHVRMDDGGSRDDVRAVGGLVKISYYEDNNASFLGEFCKFLMGETARIRDAIATVKALTPKPDANQEPAATETPTARYAKALRELADKIEKGEI